MPLTEEQQRRAEKNRREALERRARAQQQSQGGRGGPLEALHTQNWQARDPAQPSLHGGPPSLATNRSSFAPQHKSAAFPAISASPSVTEADISACGMCGVAPHPARPVPPPLGRSAQLPSAAPACQRESAGAQSCPPLQAAAPALLVGGPPPRPRGDLRHVPGAAPADGRGQEGLSSSAQPWASQDGGGGAPCPACSQGRLLQRHGRFGPFLGCDRYPECKHVHNPSNGAAAGSSGRGGAASGESQVAPVTLQLLTTTTFGVRVNQEGAQGAPDRETQSRVHRAIATLAQRGVHTVPSPSICEREETAADLEVEAVYDLANYEQVESLFMSQKHPSPLLGSRGSHVLGRSMNGAMPRATLAALKMPPVTRSEVSESELEQQMELIPSRLRTTLLPFQLEGVRFGLRRKGRCLIADEMGVGKTLQAIALATCFQSEWPMLVVVPASLRLMWLEELERWIPFLRPSHISVVFSGQDRDPLRRLWTEQEKERGGTQPPQADTTAAHGAFKGAPRIVVISYHMTANILKDVERIRWGVVLLDESHNLSTSTKRGKETLKTDAVMKIGKAAKRVVLMSGTPSLTRPFDLFNQVDTLYPGLLGRNKDEFSSCYCERRWYPNQNGQGVHLSHSGGTRLHELNLLLTSTVMIRRLKADVADQLPEKRRQIVCLPEPPLEQAEENAQALDDDEEHREAIDKTGEEQSRELPSMREHHQTGIRKLADAVEWLKDAAFHTSSTQRRGAATDHAVKWVIFAHHRDVMNGLQERLLEGLSLPDGRAAYIRIDGSTDPLDRHRLVNEFKQNPHIRAALVSVTAGGVGLDFTAASAVVFVELPTSVAIVEQAEDRLHRRGQKHPVNIYYLCAKNTSDVAIWRQLGRSLRRVRATMDGFEAAGEVQDGIQLHHVDVYHTKEPSLGRDSTCNLSSSIMANPAMSVSHASSKTTLRRTGTVHEASATSIELGSNNPPSSSPLRNASEQTEQESPASSSSMDSDLALFLKGPESPKTEQATSARQYSPRPSPSTTSHQVGVNQKTQSIPDISDTSKKACASPTASSSHDTELNNDPKASLMSPNQGSLQTTPSSVQRTQSPNESMELHLELAPAGNQLPQQGSVSQEKPQVWFEVSQYSDRVHVHTDPDGDVSHLAGSFRPEDLEHASNGDSGAAKDLPIPLQEPGKARSLAKQFLAEWNVRTLFEKRFLYDHVLQPPLAEALADLKADQDLQGSRNRTTKVEELLARLPSGAEVREVPVLMGADHLNNVVQRKQAFDSDGQPLCLQCMNRAPVPASRAGGVLSIADLFCAGRNCYREYSLRANNSGKHQLRVLTQNIVSWHSHLMSRLRRQLFQLERGICQDCGTDMHSICERIKVLPREKRAAIILQLAPQFKKRGFTKHFNRLVESPLEGNAWHADHKVAVHDGGGECGLDNLTTLCVVCHQEKTNAEKKRWLREKRSFQEYCKQQASRRNKRQKRHIDSSSEDDQSSSEEGEDVLVSVNLPHAVRLGSSASKTSPEPI